MHCQSHLAVSGIEIMGRILRYIGFHVVLFLLLSFSLYGQSGLKLSISPQTQISLITCAPGTALFEAFGHSAIRIYDPVSGLNMAYNYGVFDFDQPDFYFNFAKGHMVYKLGTVEFSQFLFQYIYYERSVQEQVLDLTYAQKQAVLRFLQINSLPENRAYYYDYFFDNCATRPRDVFLKILGDSLRFDYAYADTLNYSIRGLIDRYIEDKDQFAWGDLGIDVGLGARIDRLATPFEYMYQPEFLALAFEGATILQPDGGRRPFVTVSHTLYQGKSSLEEVSTFFTPKFAFWILLGLVVVATGFECRQRKYKLLAFDLVFFTILGLLGLLLVFLWFFTSHIAAANNWNLFWAWPSHLLAGLMLISSKPRLVIIYFLVTAVVTGLLLLSWQWVPQDMHESLVPVLILIVLRALAIIQLKAAKK